MRFYEGADGLKTGHTDDAGYCLAATAKRNNLRLIGVVLGVSSGSVRNTQTMNLLDYGFNNVRLEVLKEKNDIVDRIKIDKANVGSIDIILKEDLSVLEDLGDSLHKYKYNIKINNIVLPVKYGDVVGIIEVLENNKVVSSGELTVKGNVKKISFFDLFFNSLLDTFSGEI